MKLLTCCCSTRVCVLLWLLLLHTSHAGPPYAFFATRADTTQSWSWSNWGSGDFKAALFGSGWNEVTNCRFLTADPRLADKPLQNARDMSGKVALVHRDPENAKNRTSFVQKVLHAQQAGAVAAVVVNYKNEVLRPADVARGHSGPVGLGHNVNIPVIAVPKRIGEQLERAKHGLLSMTFDHDDMPEMPSSADEPICVVQTSGDHLAAAQKHYHDGVSLDSAKRHVEALVSFKLAIALHPRHADALNALGSVLSNHKHLHRKAGHMFQRALAVEPDEALFARNKRVTRTKMKEVDVALGEQWSAT